MEVMGEARTHSRPLGRYLALMAVAAVLGAIGVITDNPILIVGAMAVSPDLLPICAACVGFVGGRPRARLQRVRDADSRHPAHLGGRLRRSPGACNAPGFSAATSRSTTAPCRAWQPHRLLDRSGRPCRRGGGDALLRDPRGGRRRGCDLGDHDPSLGAASESRWGLARFATSWGAAGVLGVNVALLLLSGTADARAAALAVGRAQADERRLTRLRRRPARPPSGRAGGRRSRSGPAAARCRARVGRRSPAPAPRRRSAMRAGERGSWCRG